MFDAHAIAADLPSFTDTTALHQALIQFSVGELEQIADAAGAAAVAPWGGNRKNALIDAIAWFSITGPATLRQSRNT